MPSTRAEILDTAKDLITGDRHEQHGEAHQNFARIAALWSIILNHDVDATQVALCMAWLKIARLIHGPHEDSYVDAAAYMALAGELSEC